MEDSLSYCGLICDKCAIYLATREKDEEKKHEIRADIAKQIKEIYGQDCKPEDVTNCDGCKSESGRLFSGCSKCNMRKCAQDKGIDNCAYCTDYPCEELEKLFATDVEARKRLDKIKSEL
jgi:hypothetical protein